MIIEIEERKIAFDDSSKTQSVNICTSRNRRGVYEEVFYFCCRFRVKPPHLARFRFLRDARDYLRRRSYRQALALRDCLESDS